VAGLALPRRALIPGARLELQGECNRCGACCSRILPGGRRVVCEHLRAEWPVQPLGSPMASRCAVYEYRSPLRPLQVRMLDAQGQVQLVGPCHKDTWQEDQAIAEHGLGQGCSLTLKVHHGTFQEGRPR
jgi:hypothetical protein